jgi:hypothetical protein
MHIVAKVEDMHLLAHRTSCVSRCRMNFPLHVQHDKLAGVLQSIADYGTRSLTRARGGKGDEMAVAGIGDEIAGTGMRSGGKTDSAGRSFAASKDIFRQDGSSLLSCDLYCAGKPYNRRHGLRIAAVTCG